MEPSRNCQDCSTVIYEEYKLDFDNDALPALPIKAAGAFWDPGAEYSTLWAIDANEQFWTNYGGDRYLVRIPMHEFHKIIKEAERIFMEDMNKVNKAMLAYANRILKPMVIHGTD